MNGTMSHINIIWNDEGQVLVLSFDNDNVCFSSLELFIQRLWPPFHLNVGERWTDQNKHQLYVSRIKCFITFTFMIMHSTNRSFDQAHPSHHSDLSFCASSS